MEPQLCEPEGDRPLGRGGGETTSPMAVSHGVGTVPSPVQQPPDAAVDDALCRLQDRCHDRRRQEGGRRPRDRQSDGGDTCGVHRDRRAGEHHPHRAAMDVEVQVVQLVAQHGHGEAQGERRHRDQPGHRDAPHRVDGQAHTQQTAAGREAQQLAPDEWRGGLPSRRQGDEDAE